MPAEADPTPNTKPIPAPSNIAIPRQGVRGCAQAYPGGPTQGSLFKPLGALGSPFPL